PPRGPPRRTARLHDPRRSRLARPAAAQPQPQGRPGGPGRGRHRVRRRRRGRRRSGRRGESDRTVGERPARHGDRSRGRLRGPRRRLADRCPHPHRRAGRIRPRPATGRDLPAQHRARHGQPHRRRKEAAVSESIIDHIVSQRPEHDGALTVTSLGSRVRMPLSEFHDRARAVAGALLREGVRRGDRIGVLAANRLEWVLLDLAALMIGAQTAGFEPGKFTPDTELVDRYGLDRLYTDAAVPGPAPAAVRPIEEIAAHARTEPPDLEPVAYDPLDRTTVKFTSGSTGIPKGLEATVGSIDSSLRDVQALFDHRPGDDLLVFLPLSLLQQRYWLYSALRWGHDVTITTYQSVFAVMPAVNPTVVMGVPAFFDTARRHIEARVADGLESGKAAAELFGDRIRYLWTGSAPADPAMLRALEEAGLPIFEGYGLNETCIATKNHPGAHRPGSVGRPLPGKTVLIDEEGVVCVRSDHPVNTAYTYAAEGESERMFKPGGVVRTGDLGRLDEDGFLYILGRADD